MKFLSHILLAGFVVMPFLLWGQDDIQKDVRVVREYTPSISDAYKINQLPEIDDSLSFSPSFKYQILSKAMEAEFDVEPITAAKLKREPKKYLDESLVKGGIGNYSTAFGEFYYNILRSEKFALGIDLSHSSSFGKVKLEDDTKEDATYHDTEGGLFFRRFYKESTLGVDLNFKRYAYRYYGMQSLHEDTTYFVNSDNPDELYSGEELRVDPKQRYSAFDGVLSYQNDVYDNRSSVWFGRLGFGSFGNKTGVGENVFGLDGGLKFFLKSSYISINGGVQFFNLSVPDSISPVYNWNSESLTVTRMKPRVGFFFNNAEINVGLNIFGQFGGDGEDVYVGPHAEGKLVVAESIVSIFGGVTSNFNVNNFRSIVEENHYISPDLSVKNSFYGIDIFGGIKGNFSEVTSFVARFDFSSFTDEHFYVNNAFFRDGYLSGGGTVNEVPLDYSNLFGVEYDDGTLLTVSGELLFETKSDLNLLVHGKYSKWSLDDLAYAWHKPEVEIGVEAEYLLKEGWKMKGSFNSIGSRYAKNVTNGEAEKLKAVFDFNLSSEYQYSSQWLFFAGVNNILFSKYYQWNGYPSQGLNFRVGVGYSF